MLSDDYIIRMIRQATAVLKKIIGLKQAGDYQEALEEINHSLEPLLGMDIEIIKMMDDESIYGILTQNEQIDLEKLGFIADLYKEEGEILLLQNQKQQSENYYLSSINYYLKISINSESSYQKELSQKIEEIIQKLGNYNYPNKTLFDLFCYFENSGQFAKAENTITNLAVHPENNLNIRNERLSFYRRLLELEPKVLIANGMSRKQIQNKLKELG
jgi:tetratricopeptide (TPR) repeat protein